MIFTGVVGISGGEEVYTRAEVCGGGAGEEIYRKRREGREGEEPQPPAPSPFSGENREGERKATILTPL